MLYIIEIFAAWYITGKACDFVFNYFFPDVMNGPHIKK